MGKIKGDGSSSGGYEKIDVPKNPPPLYEAPSKPVNAVPVQDVWYSDNSGKFLINDKVLALTKHFEGLVLVAEDDGYGTPTVGYGRIKYPDGRKVRNGDKCTEGEAEAWLLHDLYDEGGKYVRAFLKDEIENRLTPDQFSVWVDLCFNRGCGRFRDHIAPLLNAGKFDTAAIALTETLELKTAGGAYNLGLDRRRWAERYVLEGKDWTVFKSLAYFKQFKANGYRA